MQKSPPLHHCHLMCRLDGLEGAPDDLLIALSQEDYWKMEIEVREETIRLALCNAIFMFFRHLKSDAAIRDFLSEDRPSRLYITKVLREYLHLPMPE